MGGQLTAPQFNAKCIRGSHCRHKSFLLSFSKLKGTSVKGTIKTRLSLELGSELGLGCALSQFLKAYYSMSTLTPYPKA
jgi:hypothetical protein